jgi:very-short-patch-repair endonuclease
MDGFRVLRFWNKDVDGNLVGVLDTILEALRAAPPTGLRPVPPPRSGEG